ncbi:hypothetical protein BAE44_0017100 [Dichanthelium oligosanthes]|uniref:Uncharacterized protein n=1 Tax=Dichanthelium oligosanthes TaxID=888268 RepID=A0A1E5V9P3_9POAL|nr:hypothetical protein BAE44_0017100 [Dichanthelium oligosanthes]
MNNVEEMAEFVVLCDLMQDTQFTDQDDQITRRWTGHGNYTSKSAYPAQLQGTFSTYDGKSM